MSDTMTKNIHLNIDWSAWNNHLTLHLDDDDERTIHDPMLNEPRVKYDDDGNIIYHKDDSGFWFKREYSKCGKVTHEENSLGFEFKAEYDTMSNMTRYEDSDGYWKTCKYNVQGLKIFESDSIGQIAEFKYDTW
jgi:hypothetical protein